MEDAIKPTLVMPDTAPLVHLAAGDALHILTDIGSVVLVDVVVMEATYFEDKPFARQISDWIAAGRAPGSNAPLSLVETDIGPLYRLALDQGVKRPRNAGEIAMTEWLFQQLAAIGGPALVVYENGAVPGMLARQGVAAEVAVATTRALLHLAQSQGHIENAGGPMGEDHREGADRQSAHRDDADKADECVTPTVHPVILRYSRGEISALRAAGMLGDDISVSEVIMMTKQAGLEPPRLSPEREAAEIAHAKRVLGWD